MKHSVLITGASSGIGAKTAEIFAQRNYEVLLLGRNQDRLDQVAQSLPGEGHKTFSVDLNDPKEINNLCTQLIKERPFTNSLSALINNAGIIDKSLFDKTSLESWRQQFQVNLFSAIELTKNLSPLLFENKTSFVVNVSSTLAEKPIPETLAYSSSKAALTSWTKGLALEWANKGVRVNAVHPGLIDTPIHEFHTDSEGSENRQFMDSLQPLKKVGSPIHIAEMIYFLTQPPSEWTTGSTFTVDGGIQLL